MQDEGGEKKYTIYELPCSQDKRSVVNTDGWHTDGWRTDGWHTDGWHTDGWHTGTLQSTLNKTVCSDKLSH